MFKPNPSLMITVYHHSARLVMPIGNPPDPTLTLMINSFNFESEYSLNPLLNFVPFRGSLVNA